MIWETSGIQNWNFGLGQLIEANPVTLLIVMVVPPTASPRVAGALHPKFSRRIRCLSPSSSNLKFLLQVTLFLRVFLLQSLSLSNHSGKNPTLYISVEVLKFALALNIQPHCLKLVLNSNSLPNDLLVYEPAPPQDCPVLALL